jgi:DNA-binding NtrC family response regulator
MKNKSTKPKILIVDDLPENLIALERILKQIDATIIKASSANEALALTLDHDFALILADINMPEMDGYEMIKILRSEENTKFIPVIFLTAAYTTEEDQFKGYEVGAVDFILKPLNDFILIQKTKIFLDLYHQRKELELEILNRKKLQRIIKINQEYPEIIGKSKTMQELFDLMNKVINTDVTVLIHGESGTGKELVSKAIHEKSHRKQGPFICFNCAALSETLIESELFGHEKGAFTSAEDKKMGRFELADNGTLFIDEIGELSLNAQVKLLRILQEQEFERVGGTKTISVNVRVVAATNKNLETLIAENKFREDLFYRINAFPIDIPPLRERDTDIILLSHFFLEKYAKEYKKNVSNISEQAQTLLKKYSWKGNVRELQNIISRAVLLCDSATITEIHLPFKSESSSSPLIQNALSRNLTEEELTSIYAKEVYKKFNSNKKETANALGITFKTLIKRLATL